MKKYISIFCIVILTIIIFSEQANAIPSFARKYKTSCITCHTIYPKLNPFGEAFRINGFQFPQDEEDNIKEETVSLGAESYKKVWPKAVWPNLIPASVPLSIRGRFNYEIETEDDATSSQFGMPVLQLLAATTVGSNISIFVGAHLFEDGKAGSIDRLFIKFSNLFTSFLPEKAFSIRVGQFIPEIVTFASTHRGLTNTPFAFNTYDASLGSSFLSGHVHGGGPFGIENFQIGVEVSGVLAKRFRYVGGVVNGGGVHEDINSNKDIYGRLAYKFGGMGFDGTLNEGAGSETERSVTIGIFNYYGTGTNTTTNENYTFYRIGADFNIYLSKLNIFGGYIMGQTSQENNEAYNLYFAEASYMFYPWLMGLVRYEQANPDGMKSITRIVPNISALVVANVKISLETRFDPDNFTFDNLFLGFDFAF